MFLTFNEVSFEIKKITTIEDARRIIEEFVIFFKDLAAKNIIEEIILPENFCAIAIVDSYSVNSWFIDPGVDQKYKTQLRRMLDKYRRSFNQSSINGDFVVDTMDVSAVGCTFALEHDNTTLSVSNHSLWENFKIAGRYCELDEDGNLRESSCSVDNIWTQLPIETVLSINKKELQDGISSGQDFWDKREQLFPNLVFCENVKDQLFQDSEKYHLVAVMKRLNRLQEYFSKCEGPYNPKDLGMEARTESETVKTDNRLKSLRLFRLPNGEEKYMFDHIGFSGKYKAGRIHFLPDNPNQKCYIGYIGQHLETQKY